MSSNLKKSLKLRNNYREWKEDCLSNSGYFIIFKGFLEENFLNKISGNALKLYIYLGLNSNNMEGVVWHSTNTIANYFHKSERTIRLWMKELEDNNLINKFQLNYNGVPYTHLLPYTITNKFLIQYINGYLSFDTDKNLIFKSKDTLEILTNDIYECTLPIKNKGEVNGLLKRTSKYYVFESLFESINIPINYDIYKDVQIKISLKLNLAKKIKEE